MSRAIPTTIGPHTVHLVPPLSGRQRFAVFGDYWAAYDKVGEIRSQPGTNLLAIGKATIVRDRCLAASFLSMVSAGPQPCGLDTVGRYLRAEFAEAGGIDAAVTALLDELDAQEIPVADLEVAVGDALSAGAQPTSAELEHARGN